MKTEDIAGDIERLLCDCDITPDGERIPCPTCQYYKEPIIRVANHVQRLLIEARIDELNTPNLCGVNYKYPRIKKLQQELEELK